MRKFVLLVIIVALLGLTAATVYAAPPPDGPPGLERAIAVQEAHNRELLGKSGVVGTAVGLTADGTPAIKIFTERAEVGGLPVSLDGVPVIVQVTGKLSALQGPPAGKGPAPKVNIISPEDGATFDSGASIWFEGTATDKQDGDLTSGLQWYSNIDPEFEGTSSGFLDTLIDGTHTITASVTNSNGKTGKDSVTITVGDGGVVEEPATTDRWPREVPIGISTGNANECSAGTIGARVTDGTNVYALSNNHVYAQENDAAIGEEVLQPGLYDTGCIYDPDNHLGTLHNFIELKFDGSNNLVDAAIALSSTELLGNATPSDGYGIPMAATANAELYMAVQKYGRTTQLTNGTITGINASVWVSYSNGRALFVEQIIVESRKPFIKAGDSGSLLVTDPDRYPVGLLFAGNQSGRLAVANKIGEVLGALKVSIDGE